jgi:hypothetical protein
MMFGSDQDDANTTRCEMGKQQRVNKQRRNQFSHLSYAELLEQYRGFNRGHGANKTEAVMLREMEQEIQRRQAAGETADNVITRTLSLGGCNVPVRVQA